ncbi:MAG: two component regulator propeller domain protein [Ignavibacteria bacterium]|nr:two component regulator propeller domain protein [Ignavibacteria bacterium]
MFISSMNSSFSFSFLIKKIQKLSLIPLIAAISLLPQAYTHAQNDPVLSADALGKTNLCSGEYLDITYSASGDYGQGNVFKAELSDIYGNFANPTAIGSFTGVASGTISAQIPILISSGTNYKLRVVSSSPILFAELPGSISINYLNPEWQATSGPGAGGNQYVIYYSTGSNNLFLGTQTGGIYRSADDGDTWTQLTGPNYVLCFAENNDYLFAGTSGMGLRRSSNHGDTWEDVSTGLGTGPVQAVCTNGTTIYAGLGNDGGVYQSTSNGSTWTQVWANNTIQTLVNPNFNNYILIGTNNGAYISPNDWNNVSMVVAKPQGFSVYGFVVNVKTIGSYSYPPEVYIATTAGVKYMDDLNFFHCSNAGLSDLTVYSLNFKGNTIYAGTLNNGVYYNSLTNFSNWMPLNTKLTFYSISGLAINPSSGFLFESSYSDQSVYRVATQPNSTRLISPNDHSILPTTTPTLDCDDVPGAEFYQFDIYSYYGSLVYSGSNTISELTVPAGFLNENETYHWNASIVSNCMTSLKTQDWFFSPVSNTMTYSISIDGSIPNNVCGGNSFNVPFTSLGYFDQTTFTAQLSDGNGNFSNPVLLGIYSTSGLNVSGTISVKLSYNLLPGNHYRIRVVSDYPACTGSDNGSDISINMQIPAFEQIIGPNSASFINTMFNSQAGFLVGTYNSGIYSFDMNSNNWTEQNTGLTSMNVLSFAEHNYVFAGTATGGIFRTDYYSASWTQINTGFGSGPVNAIDFSYNYNRLFAGLGNSGGIYSSIDDGANWMSYSNGLDNYNVYSIFSLSYSGCFAGTASGVYKYTYDDTTQIYLWVPKNNGIPTNMSIYGFTSIYDNFSGQTKFFCIGENSMVFSSTDFGESWVIKNSGMPANMVLKTIKSNQRTIFVGTVGNGIWQTDDFGDSWQLLSNTLSIISINSILLSNYPSTIYASELDNNILWKSMIAPKAPRLYQPANNSLVYTLTPYLSCDYSQGGENFLFEIIKNSTNEIIFSGTQYGPYLMVNDGLLDWNQSYSWRARTFANCMASDWSVSRTFSTAQITLTITNVEPTSLCPGSPISLSYTITGYDSPFDSTQNQIYLSGPGFESNPLYLGSGYSPSPGVLQVVIPANPNIQSGRNYEIGLYIQLPSTWISDTYQWISFLEAPNPQITGQDNLCSSVIGEYCSGTSTNLINSWLVTGGTIIETFNNDNCIRVLWNNLPPPSDSFPNPTGYIGLTQTNTTTGCIGSTGYNGFQVTFHTNPLPAIRGRNQVPPGSMQFYEGLIPHIPESNPNPAYQATNYWTIIGGTPSSATGTDVAIRWGNVCAGSITLTQVTDAGCTSSTFLNVEILYPEIYVYLPNKSVCRGTSINLESAVDGGTGYFTYLWSPSTGLDNANIANPTVINPTQSRYYTLTVTDNCGQVKSVSMQLTVNNLPTATLRASYVSTRRSIGVILNNQIASFNPPTGCLFTWTNQSGSVVDGSVTIKPQSSTRYYLTVRSPQGCLSGTYQLIVYISGPKDGDFDFGEPVVDNAGGDMMFVYPNPANAELNVRAAFYEKKDIEISILNIAGQEVMKYNRNGIDLLEERFNVEGLSSGMYLFTIKSGEMTLMKKFIKY